MKTSSALILIAACLSSVSARHAGHRHVVAAPPPTAPGPIGAPVYDHATLAHPARSEELYARELFPHMSAAQRTQRFGSGVTFDHATLAHPARSEELYARELFPHMSAAQRTQRFGSGVTFDHATLAHPARSEELYARELFPHMSAAQRTQRFGSGVTFDHATLAHPARSDDLYARDLVDSLYARGILSAPPSSGSGGAVPAPITQMNGASIDMTAQNEQSVGMQQASVMGQPSMKSLGDVQTAPKAKSAKGKSKGKKGKKGRRELAEFVARDIVDYLSARGDTLSKSIADMSSENNYMALASAQISESSQAASAQAQLRHSGTTVRGKGQRDLSGLVARALLADDGLFARSVFDRSSKLGIMRPPGSPIPTQRPERYLPGHPHVTSY
ncbi:hypothetical protein EUX98_g6332 [Antrodiella citrinella]|uniref:Uncharacterized protein n=1 Tax=Antrodiella citrinella TaxID=2447956 RepID=A0A4S4MQ38_9APHY|nr:hypothetical protein EUX98_g6332 [Antrodiella citrinella]